MLYYVRKPNTADHLILEEAEYKARENLLRVIEGTDDVTYVEWLPHHDQNIEPTPTVKRGKATKQPT